MENLNFFQALIFHGEFEENHEAQTEIENYFIGILANKVNPGVWAQAVAEALEMYKNIHKPQEPQQPQQPQDDTSNATPSGGQQGQHGDRKVY